MLKTKMAHRIVKSGQRFPKLSLPYPTSRVLFKWTLITHIHSQLSSDVIIWLIMIIRRRKKIECKLILKKNLIPTRVTKIISENKTTSKSVTKTNLTELQPKLINSFTHTMVFLVRLNKYPVALEDSMVVAQNWTCNVHHPNNTMIHLILPSIAETQSQKSFICTMFAKETLSTESLIFMNVFMRKQSAIIPHMSA